MCPSPLVLAQQLTHIELERLSMIGPEEFVQAFAKDTDKVRTLCTVSSHGSHMDWKTWKWETFFSQGKVREF